MYKRQGGGGGGGAAAAAAAARELDLSEEDVFARSLVVSLILRHYARWKSERGIFVECCAHGGGAFGLRDRQSFHQGGGHGGNGGGAGGGGGGGGGGAENFAAIELDAEQNVVRVLSADGEPTLNNVDTLFERALAAYLLRHPRSVPMEYHSSVTFSVVLCTRSSVKDGCFRRQQKVGGGGVDRSPLYARGADGQRRCFSHALQLTCETALEFELLSKALRDALAPHNFLSARGGAPTEAPILTEGAGVLLSPSERGKTFFHGFLVGTSDCPLAGINASQLSFDARPQTRRSIAEPRSVREAWRAALHDPSFVASAPRFFEAAGKAFEARQAERPSGADALWFEAQAAPAAQLRSALGPSMGERSLQVQLRSLLEGVVRDKRRVPVRDGVEALILREDCTGAQHLEAWQLPPTLMELAAEHGLSLDMRFREDLVTAPIADAQSVADVDNAFSRAARQLRLIGAREPILYHYAKGCTLAYTFSGGPGGKVHHVNLFADRTGCSFGERLFNDLLLAHEEELDVLIALLAEGSADALAEIYALKPPDSATSRKRAREEY